MDSVLQDLRYGLRMMLKSPGNTALATLALALGIGANTSIFSVLNSILIRPLPYAEPDRIVAVVELFSRKTGEENSSSYANFVDFRDQNTSLEALAVYRQRARALTGDREPASLSGIATTSGLFEVLGVKPLIGRALNEEDDAVGANPVVVLSHQLWQRRFAGNPSLVGSELRLDGRLFTVVGIMPPEFQFPVGSDASLWAPLSADPESVDGFQKRGRHFLSSLARLRKGISVEQASEDLNRISRDLEKQYPETNEDNGIRVVPLHDRLVEKMRPTLLLLMAAVGFVLLIACANVANLLLARSNTRLREVAIRLALGAPRSRLIRQFLTESVLLSLLGGATGCLLALWGVDLLVATVMADFPRSLEIRVDAFALAATAATSGVTGIIFGLAPAWTLSRPALMDPLKDGAGRATGGVHRHRVQGALVIAQVALALVLLAGAGLMIRSLEQLRRVDPGLSPEGVMTLQMGALPDSRYSREQKLAFFERVLDKLRSSPGVESAGVTSPLPFTRNNEAVSIKVDGAEPLARDESLNPNIYYTSHDYFSTMRIRLLEGRLFHNTEALNGIRVMVVNKSLARKLWPRESAVGKRILPTISAMGFGDWHEVVGVVDDVKHESLDGAAPLQMYVPYQEAKWPYAVLVARSAQPDRLGGILRDVVREADPDLPVRNPALMTEIIEETNMRRRTVMSLLGAFAALAILLAAIGVYGVMAYSVTERTRELGIRSALGCPRPLLLRVVLDRAVRLIAVGIALGLGAGLLTSRLLGSLLFGVESTDPLTFFLIAGLLAMVAVAASLIPAWRATRVDPQIAMRSE